MVVNEVSRPKKPPLHWEQEAVLTQGKIVCIVQSATLDNGNIRFSFRVGRESTIDPSKPFPYMSINDVANLKDVIDDLEKQIAKWRIEYGSHIG